MNKLPKEIEPAMTWKSVVSMVKETKSGDTVGYGRTYKAECQRRIATISTGYADGYNRLFSNNAYVLINGKRASVIGLVCMDQMMVDVSGITDVQIGTEVVLMGKSGEEILSADDLANMIGTIGCEIVCGISKRVKRIYVD